MTNKATSPYLNRDARSEAQARQCRALNIAYVPPSRPVQPWEGHCEDVLFHDGSQDQVSPKVFWFAWGCLLAIVIGGGLALIL